MRLQSVTSVSYEVAASWLSRWEERHRFYHTLDHLFDLKAIFGKKWDERDDLFLLAVFHDIIYDPRASDNELRSKEFMLNELPAGFKKKNREMVDSIAEAIMETRHAEEPATELGKLFCPADLSILTDSSIDQLIAYELKISKEYQVFPYELYKLGRMDFLSKWIGRNPAIKELIQFIKYRKLSIGLYADSFDPFTIGHENILEKAERIFDKVIIGRGLNPAKRGWSYALPERLGFHQQVYIGDFKEVPESMIPMEQREDHMAAFLSKHPDISFVRGLRGGSDLEMEKIQQIYIQQMMGDARMNTVYITCDREFEHISSTAFKQVAKVDANTAATCCPNGFPRMWLEP